MVKNKEKEVFNYHIYPPYIDAYINSFLDKEYITIKFQRKPTYFSRWMNFDNIFLSGIW